VLYTALRDQPPIDRLVTGRRSSDPDNITPARKFLNQPEAQAREVPRLRFGLVSFFHAGVIASCSLVRRTGMSRNGRLPLLLLCGLLLGCPGASPDQQWSRKMAEGYLKNVFEGNLDSAAAYTVTDFKYDDAVGTVQMLKGKSWQITSDNVSPLGDEAFYEGTWDATPGQGTFVVRLTKKDGKWRVEKFNSHKK
jgi:hypothetical protein